MSALREAVRSVIDRWDSSEYAASELFEALRAALEQPEQEPVAWGNGDELDNLLDDRTATVSGIQSGWGRTPLYTTPPQHLCKFPLCQNEEYQQALAEQITQELYTGTPQRKPLTDADIKLVMNGRGEEGDDDYIKPAFDPYGISEDDLIDFARAIEQAHGIGEKT